LPSKSLRRSGDVFAPDAHERCAGPARTITKHEYDPSDY